MKGKIEEMSSFRTEATDMYSGLPIFGNVARKLETKIKTMMWTNNEALVRRMKKMIDFKTVSAYMKNDPDLFVGRREAPKSATLRAIKT